MALDLFRKLHLGNSERHLVEAVVAPDQLEHHFLVLQVLCHRPRALGPLNLLGAVESPPSLGRLAPLAHRSLIGTNRRVFSSLCRSFALEFKWRGLRSLLDLILVISSDLIKEVGVFLSEEGEVGISFVVLPLFLAFFVGRDLGLSECFLGLSHNLNYVQI